MSPDFAKFFCYILKSVKSGDYYIGSSKDKLTRLKQHNSGAVKSTRYGIPWKIVHIEGYTTLKESRKRELQIKNWKSRKAIEKLMAQNRGSAIPQSGIGIN